MYIAILDETGTTNSHIIHIDNLQYCYHYLYKHFNSEARWIRICTIIPTKKDKSHVKLRIIKIIPIKNQNKIEMYISSLINYTYDSIIFGDKLDLYDYRTIQKLKIKITYEYINFLTHNGCVETLELLRNKNLITITNFNINNIANVKSLEWWKNSGLSFTYSDQALWNICANNCYETLEWWINSKLPLQCGKVLSDWITNRTYCAKRLNEHILGLSKY
jgi:hypothetical protein